MRLGESKFIPKSPLEIVKLREQSRAQCTYLLTEPEPDGQRSRPGFLMRLDTAGQISKEQTFEPRKNCRNVQWASLKALAEFRIICVGGVFAQGKQTSVCIPVGVREGGVCVMSMRTQRLHKSHTRLGDLWGPTCQRAEGLTMSAERP